MNNIENQFVELRKIDKAVRKSNNALAKFSRICSKIEKRIFFLNERRRELMLEITNFIIEDEILKYNEFLKTLSVTELTVINLCLNSIKHSVCFSDVLDDSRRLINFIIQDFKNKKEQNIFLSSQYITFSSELNSYYYSFTVSDNEGTKISGMFLTFRNVVF